MIFKSYYRSKPLHATGRRKITTTLQRVDSTLLCALIHPGPMLQVQLCNNDAGRTDNPTATILTWTESTMVLISVIASLVAGCHLCSKHRGNMRKLGIALVLVFMVWLICSNILPVAVFYLAGNTRQTAFISVNIISMITTTSAYIYAYYRMFRAIKTIGCFGQ